MHDQPPTGPADSRSSSNSAMWLVLGMCFFLFGGMALLVVGAGFIWFMRAEQTVSNVTYSDFDIAMPMVEDSVIQEEIAPARVFVIQLSAVGAMSFQGETFEPADLKERLRNQVQESEHSVVRIESDPNCPYEFVIQAMEICQGLNVPSVKLELSSKPTE